MLRIIIAPLVGAIIGFVTNTIAIKMLFRPRKALYIGGFHIPFTPGLIPLQKNRIALSLGRIVSKELLNRNTIANALISEENINKLRNMLLQRVEAFKNDERTVDCVIKKYISEEDVEKYKSSLKYELTKAIVEKINETDMGTILAQSGMEMMQEKLGGGLLAMFISDDFIHNTKNILGSMINELIREKAPDMIYKEIGVAEENILSMKISDIFSDHEDKISEITDKIPDICKTLIEENMDKIMEIVDIESIVAEKIKAFDPVQLEQLIFGIMNKELKAIEYLGALLGFFMGFINLLF